MILKYLGTAAAEGVPAVFCNCRICREARVLKGKNVRTRSQALVNGDLLIDLPPDTYMHYIAYDFNLPDITELLVTHSHTDHFYATELEMRCSPLAYPEPPVMRIYCNEAVEKKFRRFMPDTYHVEKNFAIVRAVPFVPLAIGGYTVVPLLASHDKAEECLLYLISEGEKTILYGNDSGVFPEATFSFLEKCGKHIDLASFDCTLQSWREGTNHMGLGDAAETRDRLKAMSVIDDNTLCVLNHFSHNGLWSYARMKEEALKEGFIVAYDGLTLEV
ncbi:MAG TPA: MBL fold metallo-hydrolase [Rectinemataceae bacterium]|nr:MBL fold metallo-hydrolase [Rectinemataceae bacterium]